MAGDLIWAFRVMRLALLDAGGSSIGRIHDIVAVPSGPGADPLVVGFVAETQRRRVFINANRLSEIGSDGMRLRSWDVDLNPFTARTGEFLLGRDIIDRRVGDETVSDVALRPSDERGSRVWRVAKVRLSRRSPLRRRSSYRLVDAGEVRDLFPADSPLVAEIARLRDMHPSDVAAVIRSLPVTQRQQLAAAMDDERLADVLEELPEAEQVRLVGSLDMDRLVGVLDEMDFDDLADLLGEMSREQRTKVLAAMEPDDAEVVRRLLSYEAATAGGMMTPKVIVLGPTNTVAEALAQIRRSEWVVSIAAQVFVCHPPLQSPTGKFLGTAHMQRLLREPPSTELRTCLSLDPTVTPATTDVAVAEVLASYDMLAVAVCDDAGHLLGAVTVDDVLDRQLGAGWRQRQRARHGHSADPRPVGTT